MTRDEARALLADPGSARFTQLRFDEVDLSGLVLDGLWLHGCSFVGADLRGTQLRHGYFNLCDFRRADLRGAQLVGSHLLGCDFRFADLRGADLTRAHFGSTATGAKHVRRSNLSDIQLDGATIATAIMEDVIGWSAP